MSRKQVFEKVSEIVCDKLDLDMNGVTETSVLGDDLGSDSLDNVEIIMQIEDEFHIEIPDQDFEKAKTVGDLVDIAISKGGDTVGGFDPAKPQLVWKPWPRSITATNAELSPTSVLNVHASIPLAGMGGKTQWGYKVMISGSVVDLGNRDTEVSAQVAAEQVLARIVESLPVLEIIKTSKEGPKR